VRVCSPDAVRVTVLDTLGVRLTEIRDVDVTHDVGVGDKNDVTVRVQTGDWLTVTREVALILPRGDWEFSGEYVGLVELVLLGVGVRGLIVAEVDTEPERIDVPDKTGLALILAKGDWVSVFTIEDDALRVIDVLGVNDTPALMVTPEKVA
jgi:hypothetical protein